MSLKLSLGEIIANLEARIVFHRDQAALHTKQEEHHREQRTLHEADLQKVTEHCEVLKAVAGPAAEMALPTSPGVVPTAAAPSARPEAAPGPPPNLSVLILQLLKAHPDGEPFGQTSMAAAIRQRFRHAGQPLDPRSVSAALRRLLAQRHIQVVREGRPCHEALYAKGARAGG